MCDQELLAKSSPKSPDSPTAVNQNRNILPRLSVADRERRCKPFKRRTKLFLLGLVVVGLVALLFGFFLGWPNKTSPPKPDESAPKLRVFQKAAVCTDAPVCSEVGRSILIKNGSAVDAAVAALFCNGLLNAQSMGLGGGFFMTVYIKDEEKAYAVDARETAPAKATVDMFLDNVATTVGPIAVGPHTVGVPGQLRGMWAAYQRWGKLPWATLIEPSLEICKAGFIISKPMHLTMNHHELSHIRNDTNLRKTFYDESREKFHEAGTLVKMPEALCNTLRRIAEKGGDELYSGTLAQEFADDLARAGTVITLDDLRNYQAKILESLAVQIGNGDTLYSPPPPSSGIVLMNILNILQGYKFNASSIGTTEDEILTYHRIVEAFKHAYAMRTRLGDMLDLKELIQNMSSPEYGAATRLTINDTSTSNDTSAYGTTTYNPSDSGTAHISIIAANGDAVSVTSSINFYFGAGFTTLNTGIIMNDVLADFSYPGLLNEIGLKPSPANYFAPGKRPVSSMSPSIIVDSSRNVKLVIGAAGSAKIPSAVALVIMRKLWFGKSIKEAVDEARIHHQTFPMEVRYEYGITKDTLLNGLREKGHGVSRYPGISVVCALFRNSTAIYGNADFRKGGDVSGTD